MTPSLEITTRLAPKGAPCPNDCGFCPQGKLRRALEGDEGRGAQTFEDLEQLTYLLSKVPTNIQIHFSGYTEPFFNRNTAEALMWCKGAGYVVHLYSTLMGLRESDLKSIPKNLDHVMIHFPDVRYLKINDDIWIRQHMLWRKLGIPYKAMAMGPLTPRVLAHTQELGWPDGVELPRMNTRAGNVRSTEFIGGNFTCVEDRWHNNVLLPNGNVYLCCMDYSLKHRLGNLYIDTYEEIWEQAEWWKHNTNSPSAQSIICRNCEHAVPTDNNS